MPRRRYLLVSDLHLDAASPAAVAQFLGFLDGEATRCDGLYILGDLFESWIGDDDDEGTRRQVCAGLRRLTQRGVPCRIQHGNRDFLLGAAFAARTGCELVGDPLVLQLDGHRVVLSHGDALCTGDVAYQRFRRVTRSHFVQRTWLALPLPARRTLAGLARRRSHAHTRRLPAAIMDVAPEAVAALLRATRADILIHGHTHRPGVHRIEVDGRECTRIVLGDWYEQGSVLALNSDGSHASHGLQASPTLAAQPLADQEAG